jgi:hypothetical protein
MHEWAGAPYVRIYSTLARDHRRVWRDDQLLAGYVRLLMAADAAWPGPAELPRGADPDMVARLVAEEVIDVEDDLYHFHGLDEERRGRAKRGQIGGFVRAAMADRDSLGRFAGTSLDAAHTNGAVEPVEAIAGTSASGPASPASQPASPPARREAGEAGAHPPRAPARTSAPARDPRPDPSRIACRDYDAHRAEHHWWGAGIGWKCSICEREDGESGQTFRERAERHTPPDSPF